MKIIAGLGNPGRQYEETKHNAGFMVVDKLAAEVVHTPWREEQKALVCTFTLAGEKIMLVKPQTFMNLSGEAVGPLMRYYKLTPEDVFCIYDDMDLPVGKLRIRPGGSAGGHNGIKSMIAHVGSEHFIHFRLGIGRPLPQWTVIDHVLAPFPDDQKEKFAAGVEAMAKAVLGTAEVGVDKGMNLYNPRKGRSRQATAEKN